MSGRLQASLWLSRRVGDSPAHQTVPPAYPAAWCAFSMRTGDQRGPIMPSGGVPGLALVDRLAFMRRSTADLEVTSAASSSTRTRTPASPGPDLQPTDVAERAHRRPPVGAFGDVGRLQVRTGGRRRPSPRRRAGRARHLEIRGRTSHKSQSVDQRQAGDAARWHYRASLIAGPHGKCAPCRRVCRRHGLMRGGISHAPGQPERRLKASGHGLLTSP